MTFKQCSFFAAVALLAPAVVFGAVTEESSACEQALHSADRSNAVQLWRGADWCAQAGDTAGATFLLLAGQIRAMTDMATLEASTDADKIKVSELYGMLYFQTGGSGDDEIYRSPEGTQALFDRLSGWAPVMDASYDPGWAYDETDAGDYNRMVACQRAERIQKLRWYASLIGNDEYYAASNELNELRAANPGAVTAGSDLDRQMDTLLTRMTEATAHNEMPRSVPPECEFAAVYVPDPDADFMQLHSGANGPAVSRSYVYESRRAVLESWIARSLSPAELAAVLDQVDFGDQILVAVSAGKRTNATGTIYVSDVDSNAILESLTIGGMIGVNVKDCEQPRFESFPFALAVAPRPETVPPHPSMSVRNFPDGCKPAISGVAVTESE